MTDRIDVRRGISEAIAYYESTFGTVAATVNGDLGAFINRLDNTPGLSSNQDKINFLRGIQGSPVAMNTLDRLANDPNPISNRDGYMGVLAGIYAQNPGQFATRMRQLDQGEADYILNEARVSFVRGRAAVRDFGDNGQIDNRRTASLDDNRNGSFASGVEGGAQVQLASSFTGPAFGAPAAVPVVEQPGQRPVVGATLDA
jgi:hypothetical protein